MPERVDLHNHLGAAVDPAIMWSIAHTQGIKLPGKNYWDFEKMITIGSADDYQSVAEVDKQLFYWSKNIAETEKISEERLGRWQKLWCPYSELTEE